ncbi:MAG: DUF4476 domain-containing protein [Bacteroidales bacterium]|nr:DUF4476 domain-containing protein [Bacteroidales bacterium]
MRNFIFTSLLVLCAFVSYAQPQPTSLAIQADNHERFWIYVNNVLQNNSPSESVFVPNMTPNAYAITITMDNPGRTTMTTQIQVHPGKNYYSVSYQPYNDMIALRSLDQDVQMAGQMIGAFTQMTAQMNAQYEADVNRPTGHSDHHHGNHPHGQPGNAFAPPAPAPAPAPAPMPCSDWDFKEIKQLIQNETFEHQKLTIAKQATAAELLTVDQLAEIAMLFDFENTKLEYLKFAYDYCYDPNKYYKLNKVFDFSHSIDELNEYIQNHR